MGDMAEDFRSLRAMSRMKKMNNQTYSTELLTKEGVKFTTFNNGQHLVIDNEPLIDFWPATGLWIIRGGDRKRGVKNLLRYLRS